jgi:hypothetical protein
MKPQKNTNEGWKNVKVPAHLVEKMLEHKEKTYMPMSVFLTEAIEEKFKKIGRKKK